MKKILLNIATPKNVLIQDEVEMVVVPGLHGDIGITFGERVLTFILKPGIIYLFNNNKVSKRYFIMGGNFITYDNKLSINTNDDIIFDLNELDKEKVTSYINQYRKLIESNNEEVAKIYYKKKILQYEKLLEEYKTSYYT